jgi:hypothetical protein
MTTHKLAAAYDQSKYFKLKFDNLLAAVSLQESKSRVSLPVQVKLAAADAETLRLPVPV